MVKKIIISFCILSILILATGLAEEKETKQPVPFGESITIQSKILNEDRIIYIALPSGYEESNNHYPVLYRLDGSVDSFLAMAGLVKYLEWTLTPPMIVVAIPNTNRGRDMSVGPHDQLPGGPGGENFLKFIVDELIPYINKNFRATSLNLITGGSAAGKFSTWAMIKHPEIFKIAISGSPAYGGYSWESMKHDTEDAYMSNKLSGNLLFISFFDRDSTISSNDVLRYIDLIGQMDKKKIDYIVRVQKGDKHVTPDYQLDGLLSVFKGWTIPEPLHFEPTSAELMNDSFDLKIITNENEIRYTLDGTEPTRTSPLYKDKIKIDKPLTLKARIYRDLIYEGTPVSLEFKSGTIRKAEQPVGEVKSGLNYKYYEKDWFRIPETGEFDLKPDKTGITAQVNTDNRTKDTAFMFEFSGYLKVPEDGAYTMYIGSSSRSKLFIDNEEIVYNNTYNRKKETSSRIHLQKGLHKVKVLYMNAWYQGTSLIFSWEGPGIEKQEVSPEYLFHTE